MTPDELNALLQIVNRVRDLSIAEQLWLQAVFTREMRKAQAAQPAQQDADDAD